MKPKDTEHLHPAARPHTAALAKALTGDSGMARRLVAARHWLHREEAVECVPGDS